MSKRNREETETEMNGLDQQPQCKSRDVKQEATLSGQCDQCNAEIPRFFLPGMKRTGFLLLPVNSEETKPQDFPLLCSYKCISEYSSRRVHV